MKQTALNEIHKKLQAKMVPFAGFEMPVQYEGINIEHETVRRKLGVFDVSHMGEFLVKGPKAYDLVQWLTSNDVKALHDGKVQYSCFPNEKGGIVDDLLVYQFSANEFFLVVNAANIEKDFNWCKEQNKFGAELTNVSDEYAQLAIQGPEALKSMQKLTDESIEDMEYYTFKIIEFAGIKDVIFSTTGYTGSGGCEVYVKNKDAVALWHKVMEAGAPNGIKPIGLAARDTLRLESGFCLYGNDITDNTSPIEAGLGWITKFSDDNNFINREALQQQKENGVSRKLTGFVMEDKGIPRHDYPIFDAKKNEIGIVTSGTMSPMLKKGIGMGYVSPENAKKDTDIYIKVRDKFLKAKTQRPPFWKA